jgi:hypothetical protein
MEIVFAGSRYLSNALTSCLAATLGRGTESELTIALAPMTLASACAPGDSRPRVHFPCLVPAVERDVTTNSSPFGKAENPAFDRGRTASCDLSPIVSAPLTPGKRLSPAATGSTVMYSSRARGHTSGATKGDHLMESIDSYPFTVRTHSDADGSLLDTRSVPEPGRYPQAAR